MVESAQRLWARSWCCQNNSDASCSPYLRLCWRFKRSCALCAQTGCCYETHQQFLRDSLFPVSVSVTMLLTSVCEILGMSRAVVESRSIFISTHTDMLTVCTTLFLYFTACQRKYIWGKCCLLFKFRLVFMFYSEPLPDGWTSRPISKASKGCYGQSGQWMAYPADTVWSGKWMPQLLEPLAWSCSSFVR